MYLFCFVVDSFLFQQAPYPPYPNLPSFPDMFSGHNPYSWSSPFDENIYLQHALTASKFEDFSEEYHDYPNSLLELTGLEDTLIAPKEELEFENKLPELVNEVDFISPSLFYYPLSPTKIFTQIETRSSLPLFTLPPISQLISNEN